jgi:hypothetical protein
MCVFVRARAVISPTDIKNRLLTVVKSSCNVYRKGGFKHLSPLWFKIAALFISNSTHYASVQWNRSDTVYSIL